MLLLPIALLPAIYNSSTAMRLRDEGLKPGQSGPRFRAEPSVLARNELTPQVNSMTWRLNRRRNVKSRLNRTKLFRLHLTGGDRRFGG
jgi:hypothetical protein